MANKTISADNTKWTGTSKKDTVQINADYVKVNTGKGNDSIKNSYFYAWYSTIDAGSGNDTITFNTAKSSSINAGAGNDRISLSSGSDLTIKGGSGNDTVYAAANNNLYQYALGDGNDVIYNWGAGDTLSITGGSYTKKTSGNDVILTVGSGKISLVGAKGKDFTIKGTLAGGGGKTINNTTNKKKLTGTSSADTITNSGLNVTINAGKGNDKVYNEFGNNTSISAGTGNDSIYNRSFYTTILGGIGKDTVENYNGAWALINTGDGNDSITNINAYDDDGHYVTISSGAGDDKISNQMGNKASINAGEGNDSIYDGSWFSTILGGAGKDSIKIDGDSVTVDAGIGNDYVEINSKNVSIVGGKDNDTIVNNGTNNIYKYASGDGNDVIYNLGTSDTIKITGAKYTKKTSGNDVIITVGKGKITLKGAKGKTLNIDGTLNGKLNIPSNALKYNGHSYYIYSGVANTWNEAKAYCESRGGHLAVINNAKENTKLFNYMKSKGYDSAYFGLSDAAKEGTWTWANGDKVSYKNWAGSEPNGGTTENYGMFYWKFNDGKWNDGDFSAGSSFYLDGKLIKDTNAFICEWDTVTTGGGTSTVTVPTVQPEPTVPSAPSGDVLKGTNGHDNLKNGDSWNENKDAGKVIYAYGGNDTVTNYANNVYISGGAGNDYITSKWGSNSTVLGGAGTDKITVQSNNAFVYGENDNDSIWTYNEGNFIYGGKGNDYIYTKNNNNGFVSGDEGNDRIIADSGTYLTLSGGAGNDYLWGGTSSDTLIGGAGDDTFVYKPGQGTDHITDFSGGDMLKILNRYGDEGGTFTSATFSGGNLTLAISGGGSVVLDNVSSGQSININGSNYKISGSKLVKK